MRKNKVIVVLLFILKFCLNGCNSTNNMTTISDIQINFVECKNGALKDAALADEWVLGACDDYSTDDCAEIYNCPPPDTTYSKFLNEIGFGVAPIKHLFLNKIPAKPVFSSDHIKGLPLVDLRLSYDENLRTYPSPAADFLEKSTELRYINFRNGKFPPMPAHSVVEVAILINGASAGAFGGCNELRSLDLQMWAIYEEHWLAGCPKLTSLKLTQMPVMEVERTIRDVTHLKHLVVDSWLLDMQTQLAGRSALPDWFFDNLSNLVTLHLDNIGIISLPSINITMPYLEELVLMGNNLDKFDDGLYYRASDVVLRILNTSPKLRFLDVSYNRNLDLCIAFYTEWTFLKFEHPKLRSLNLDYTNSSIDCITKEGLPALEKLSLIGTRLTKIFFTDLLISKRPLFVAVGFSSISTVYLDEFDYEEIYNRSKTNNKLNLEIEGLMPLDCDCKNSYFIKLLREGLVNGTLIICKHDEMKYFEMQGKEKLTEKEVQETYLNLIDMCKLECHKYTCSGCLCRRDWSNSYVVANCTGADIKKVPRFPSDSDIGHKYKEILRSLYAAQNHIEKLTAKDIPRSLVFADLSSNHIAHIDEETTREMFISQERRLRLSHNPIACDCENYFFLKTLQEHSNQIEDYANMTCRSENIEFLISNVNINQLCPKITVLTASLVVGGVFLLCVIAGTFVHYRYGRAVRIFVHARGWFAWCVKEDTMDADRKFDAFVSFCHTDTALVEEQFLPKLEELGYRICVHYRDWVPGELIPTHIVRSVESSRRTVVLLSRSFLASMWGLLEFRIAHARALHDGVQRLILILLDDVQETDLDPDLRSYLRSNTYVRWDDPWFWDKIRYALPRPRSLCQTDPKDDNQRDNDPSGRMIMFSNINVSDD